MNENMKLVLDDVRNGRAVLIVDNTNREDEADVCLAAEKANEFNLAFSMLHARGLMCLSMLEDRINRLEIPSLPTNSKDKFETPFQCPVDASVGTTTGMSVFDRLKTFSVFLNEDSKPEELHYPGHMQVLKARKGLLNEREGHTESSVTLMLLAGLKPVAMIQEIINADGTMLRGDQVKAFVETYNLRVVSVQEIKEAALEVGIL